MSSEEGEDNASDLLSRPQAVVFPGSTTTHTKKVNVATVFGQKMFPVLAYFTKFPQAATSATSQCKMVRCYLGRADVCGCPLSTRIRTKKLIRHLQSDNETEWELVQAASSR